MKKLLLKPAFIVCAFILISSSDAAASNGKGHGGGPGEGPGKGQGIGHGYDHGPGQGPGKGNGYGHNKGPKNSVPIDGGASALLAAGAAYGLKKLRDTRNKKNESELAA